MLLQKRILLSLLTLSFGTALIASNMVYATGNPAESHDSTSPTRRVEDMNYRYLSYNDTACSECHKKVEYVNKVHNNDGHHYRHHGHHHNGHHHKHHHHGHHHGHHHHGHHR